MNLLVSRKRLLGNTGDFLWSYGGYLIVSALCDLCGVTLDESNTRNFIADCIENLHDTLKANLSVDGANYSLSLSDDFINEFIDFYSSVGEKTYIYNNGDECIDVTGGYRFFAYDGYTFLEDDKNPNIDSYIHENNGQYLNLKIVPKANCHYGTSSCAMTKKNIDLTKYTSMKIEFIYNETGLLSSEMVWIGNNPIEGEPKDTIFDEFNTTEKVVKEESLKDLAYKNSKINFVARTVNYNSYGSNSCEFKIYKAWLEKKYDIGDSYVKTLEEYKAKYEKEPSKIILDSSIVDIKTKWKKEDTEIYIPDGDIKSLPNGVSISYAVYLFKEGNQCTSITGGWKDYYLSGAQFTDNCILLSQSETHNMFAGTINEIDFSKYTKMYLDMKSTNYCYLLNQTAKSAESTLFYWDYSQGTNRKIVSFSLEDKKISTIIYCAIFNPCTAKIYNIWLE